MGTTELSYRIAGIAAVCLAALVAPVEATTRILLLAAFSLGVGAAAVLPGYEKVAARIVGPAVLLLAVGPASEVWTLVDLVALTLIGFASFDPAGMSRAVPALGLPVTTLAFRSGEVVPPILVGLWAAMVVVTLVLSNHLSATRHAVWMGVQDDDGALGVDDALGRHLWLRTAQTVAAAAVVVPLTLLAAGLLARHGPDLAPAGPREGGGAGSGAAAHPGLDGGLDVGQRLELGDEEVLRVRSDRRLHWRGLTYDQWDGRRWTRSPASDDHRWDATTGGPGVGTTVELPAAVGSGTVSALDLPAPVAVRQEFEVRSGGIDVLVGAWQARAVSTTATGGTVGDDGALRLDRPLSAGAVWTVESEIVPAEADDLRRADPLVLAPDSAIVARYGSEDNVDPEVALAAVEIVTAAGAGSTYDRIRAIEAWFTDELTYTRDIPTLPAGADPVRHLLFESKQGYCEQIGTALVVMLRSLGIPSRLVVGYVPSRFDASTGQWVSEADDAHAWAEVWFPGVGWQGFDPTAEVPLAAESDAGTGIPVTEIVATALVGVLAVGVVGVLTRRRDRLGAPTGGERGESAVLAGDLAALGAALGLDWSPHLTVRERGDGLVAAGVDPEVVTAAVRALERVWYGVEADQATGVRLDAARQAVDRLSLAVGERVAAGLVAVPAGGAVGDGAG